MHLFLIACTGTDDSENTKETGTDDTQVQECVTHEVSCVDEMISSLSLQDEVSEDEVLNETSGEDWLTYIDASAGGYSQASRNPWVYVKFTDEGAQKVEIDDESSLESVDWDLAAHRYVLRLNGGSSGPSCVGAAVMGEGYTYENLTSVPEGVEFAVDDYYTDSCTLVNDSSGLEVSPQTVLSPWWEYPDCVATTGQPFLIQLADGRVLKFKVDSYYANDGQTECNENHSTSESGGFFWTTWRFL